MVRAAGKDCANECPYCKELLGPANVHICPVGCCFVEGYVGEEVLICPYCEQEFDIFAGHVCLELIRLSEPVQ